MKGANRQRRLHCGDLPIFWWYRPLAVPFGTKILNRDLKVCNRKKLFTHFLPFKIRFGTSSFCQYCSVFSCRLIFLYVVVFLHILSVGCLKTKPL